MMIDTVYVTQRLGAKHAIIFNSYGNIFPFLFMSCTLSNMYATKTGNIMPIKNVDNFQRKRKKICFYID